MPDTVSSHNVYYVKLRIRLRMVPHALRPAPPSACALASAGFRQRPACPGNRAPAAVPGSQPGADLLRRGSVETAAFDPAVGSWRRCQSASCSYRVAFRRADFALSLPVVSHRERQLPIPGNNCSHSSARAVGKVPMGNRAIARHTFLI